MYTQCSSCATLFRVTPRHLRRARGLVRCCLCRHVFDALASLADALPPQLGSGSLDRPRLLEGAATDDVAGVADDKIPADPLAAAAAESSSRRTAAWSVLALVLLAALIVQYAYVMREELARYPRSRPWVETLCLAAGCELPPLRDVSRIHILYREVGLHPTVPGALLAKATIVNDTGFRQPYPQIRFSFLDPSGDTRASRWFSPDDYLGGRRAADVPAGMPPQEPVAVRLELTGISAAARDNFALDVR